MSTIAEFISGTVNESLKKLLQPVGLIPASIFVLLNLAFVYPSARANGNHLALLFAGLDTATQAAVVGLIALGLGYFLLSGSSKILDVLGGEQMRGSTLYSVLVWLQKRKRARLMSDVDNFWYASRRFYIPFEGEHREPLPTALGNVLFATQGTVERRYGIDMAVFWSQFVATPEIKDLPARAIVEDERASRDILCNAAFVLWSFALEGLVFFTFRGEPRNALLALLAVPAGYVAYRVAVAKAEAWGDAVETLFDLHRDKLHSALKLAPYGNASEERRVWERATRFFVALDDPESSEDPFVRDDAPVVTAIPAGEITVPDSVSAVIDGLEPYGDSTWLRWVEYVVLVARQSGDGAGAAGATDAEVLVDDPRVVRIASAPPPQTQGGVTAAAQIVRGSGGSDLLLWKLGGLSGGSAISLRYKLPLLVLWANPVLAPKLEPGIGFVLEPPVPPVLVEVRLSHLAAGGGRPELRLQNAAQPPADVSDATYVWQEIAVGDKRVWLVPPAWGPR
jgi:hypothetical protein